jgi:cell division septum initiation protein DivIVA
MSYDDNYSTDERYDGQRQTAQRNDYDDVDENDYSSAGAPGNYVGDAETLLRRAIDIVATAPTMPLSSSPRIDRDEIIELLEESLNRLPDELRQARWMLKERQDFVAKTRREADELLEAARVRAERMVQRTEVVRAAEQRARQVMETAEADSRRLKHETEDFLDQRLGSFEILLDKLGKTVHAGRQRLSIGGGEIATDVTDDDDTHGFFDQEA